MINMTQSNQIHTFFLTKKFLFVVASGIVPSAFHSVVVELHAVLVFVATWLLRVPIGVLHELKESESEE